MWSKKLTITYRRIEAAEEDYFGKFYDNAETMISTNNKSSSFDAGEAKYQWELLERIETDSTSMYIFSLAKEKSAWPVLLTEDGSCTELSITNGSLGDISYGLVCPAYKFLICFAAGSGGSATHFKKFLGQFSPEGVVRLNPLFENNIDEKVMNWDSYKKISIKMNMPSNDDATNFAATKAGEQMKMLGFLGGLKVDISVSAGGGKETLSSMMVKDILPELLANDLCTSLTVKGSDFENASMEQYDVKNAQIKYSEQLEVEGNYITAVDAKNVLMRALNEGGQTLFSE